MRSLRRSALRRVSRLGAGLVLGIMLTLGTIGSAFATADTGVTVTGGSLGGGTITWSTFPGVTLNGTKQTTTASWGIGNITDSTGTGAGWNLSLTLTQLKQYDTSTSTYTTSGHTIPTSSITVTTVPTITQADASSSPTSTITPVTLNTALDTGSPVKLLSAAANGGMGSYSFGNLGATLSVPATTFAATYKTDATVSLTSGP